MKSWKPKGRQYRNAHLSHSTQRIENRENRKNRCYYYHVATPVNIRNENKINLVLGAFADLQNQARPIK